MSRVMITAVIVPAGGTAGIGAQEVLTITPDGNVDVAGNLAVTGAVTATGTVQADNIEVLENSGIDIFTGMLLIDTTFPTRVAANADIALPGGWSMDNSIILSATIETTNPSETHAWNTLPMVGSDGRVLRANLIGTNIRLENRWHGTYTYDNERVRIVVARIGP